jgi:hypothetical protein
MPYGATRIPRVQEPGNVGGSRLPSDPPVGAPLRACRQAYSAPAAVGLAGEAACVLGVRPPCGLAYYTSRGPRAREQLGFARYGLARLE